MASTTMTILKPQAIETSSDRLIMIPVACSHSILSRYDFKTANLRQQVSNLPEAARDRIG
jgi:hypothetical protein